jgi:hypothetical protein
MKIVTLSALFLTCLSLHSSANNSTLAPFGVNNIVLKSFLASTDGKSTRLTWELAEMEQEVSCFIERSEDGLRFSKIETMHIKKGFNGVMSLIDKQVSPGLYYYRLHISKPGFIPYLSNIISIRINKESETEKNFRVMNPFSQQITINGKFGNSPLRIEVADMNGRVRIVKTIKPSLNSQSISFSAAALDKGTYILRIKEEKAGELTLILTKHIIKNE